MDRLLAKYATRLLKLGVDEIEIKVRAVFWHLPSSIKSWMAYGMGERREGGERRGV